MVIRAYDPADENAVVELIRDYLTWAEGRLEEEYGVGESPTDITKIADSLSGYVPPKGLFLVVEEEGKPVGVGALRMNGPGVAEIKRMYVDPAMRGRRLGSALMDELLRHSRETFQARTVRLDSCGFMHDAHRLYGSRGFQERSPYEGTEIPPHLQKYWRFFEMEQDVPENQETIEYGASARMPIYLDDLDVLGTLHNSHYALLVERALNAWWADHGVTFVNGRPTTADAFNVVRDFRISYHRPVLAAGDVALHFWIEKIGTTSVEYRFRCTSVDGGTLYADGHRVNVKVNPKTMRPEPWTDDVRLLAKEITK